MSVYVIVFLALVAVWIAGQAGSSPPARSSPGPSAGWGHILLPVVLIALGVVILVEGGAFGL